MKEKNREKKKEILRLLTGVGQQSRKTGGLRLPGPETYGSTLSTKALSLRLFGPAVRRKKLSLPGKHQPEDCRKAFAELGRVLELASAPEETAVYITPLLSSPYLLTASAEQETVTFTYYSARSLFGRGKARRAFGRLMKVLPAGTAEAVPTEEPELSCPPADTGETSEEAPEPLSCGKEH